MSGHNFWKGLTLANCNGTIHELEEVKSFSTMYDQEAVVRWCRGCGAVVIDMDHDTRTYPGYYAKMRFPRSVQEKK